MEPGEHALLRHVLRGRVGWARPVVVVRDGPDRVELLRFAGSHVKRPERSTVEDLIASLASGTYEVVDATWDHTNVLEIAQPGRWSSTWPMWFSRSSEFAGWYVNFQEPLRRSRLGWDTFDLALDIVVSPNLSWRWKDDDHFALMQDAGVITRDAAAEVQREAERVIDDIDSERYPFDQDWSSWQPHEAWLRPTIPAGWDEL